MAVEQNHSANPAGRSGGAIRSRLHLNLSPSDRVRIALFILLTVGLDTFLYYGRGMRFGSAREVLEWLMSPLQVAVIVWIDKVLFPQGIASQAMFALAIGSCALGSWIRERNSIDSIIFGVWFAREALNVFVMYSRKDRNN
jgi:hypothetical protein